MKKLLLFISFAICALTQNSLYAQQFHSDDKNGMQNFLRQSSAEEGKLNLEQLGLSISDTLNWNTSEEWIKKIQDITWKSVDSIQRIIKLEIVKKQLSGSLDAFGFKYLEALQCQDNQLTDLNVTDNPELTLLYCGNNQLTSLNVNNSPKLNSFACQNNQLISLSAEKSTKLAYLYCYGNRLKFSTLPTQELANFRYAPQATINDTIASYKPINLSAEYSVNEYVTNHIWHDDNLEPIVLTHKGSGIFEANAEHENKTLTCKMTNDHFPGLTIEYKVFIVNDSELSINPETAEPSIFDAEIYDISGRLLKQATNVTEAPVKNLQNGTYIVVKTTEKGKWINKIIKK